MVPFRGSNAGSVKRLQGNVFREALALPDGPKIAIFAREMAESEAKKQSKGAAFLSRLMSSLLSWAIVAGVFYSQDSRALIGLVLVIGVLGIIEFTVLTQSVGGRDARLWALVVSLGYFAWLTVLGFSQPEALRGENFLPEMVGLALVVMGAFVVRLRHAIGGPESVLPIAIAVLGFCYVPILFVGFMSRLAFLAPDGDAVMGIWLLLLIAVSTKFTDMGAYLVGSLIGRHKAIPHISPAKSWEGYIGSIFFTIGGSLGIYYLGGEHFAWIGSVWHVVALSILIALAAMVGDLAESILKRSLHVKDSGKILPGIGGVLDLIDSLCFSAPLTYFYLKLFVL